MERQHYIDCMRGFTMILVVYSHIVVFGYDINRYSLLNEIFVLFRMPLFFWVSGYLAYSFFDAVKLKKKIKKDWSANSFQLLL